MVYVETAREISRAKDNASGIPEKHPRVCAILL
jgi:hypothetical protein